jgi:hypothetical protein
MTTRFLLNQKVWSVESKGTPITVHCPTCEGNGEVAGADGRKVYCTQCAGTGYHTIGYTKVYWTRELQIGQVTKTVGHGEGEKYMCHETGLGSGLVWDVGSLYGTEEEAATEVYLLQAVASAAEDDVRSEYGLGIR